MMGVMKKEDQVKYLANIFYLLLSDGEVETVEKRVYENIARDIGAGYLERKAAKESAESGLFNFQYVDRWSDRVRNLEDLLFAAFCNGVSNPDEKKHIKSYLKPLRVNQEQVDILISEAKRRYKDFTT